MTSNIFDLFSGGDSALPTLDVIIRSTVILGLATIITLCLRSATSATRHLVWTTSLITVLVLPILYVLGPSINVAMLPASQSATTEWASSFSNPSDDAPIQTNGSQTGDFVAPATPNVNATSAPNIAIDASNNQHSGSDIPGAITGVSSIDIQPLDALFYLWLFGACVVGLRLLVAHLGLALLSSRASLISDSRSIQLMSELTSQLDIRRHVSLKRTSRNVPPLTWGIFNPVVILPSRSEMHDEESLRSVLLHELAHIRRLDWFTQLLGQITCVLYWFNPLVWYAHSRQQIEQEMACDDRVIRSGTAPSNYASNLLDILRGARTHAMPAYASTAMARKSTFEGRLVAILDPDRRRGELNPLRISLTITALGVLLLPLVAVHPVPVQNVADTQKAVTPHKGTDMEQPAVAMVTRDDEFESASGIVPPATEVASNIAPSETENFGDVQPETLPDLISLEDSRDELRQEGPYAAASDTTKLRAMIVALSDEDAEIRRLAAHILGEMENSEAISPLTQALDDPDKSVRSAAARALGEIGSPSSVPALARALQDEDADVRSAATWALAEIEDESAAPALEAALGDENRNVRMHAARALGELDSPVATQALIKALQDPVPDVRLHAARALGEIESKDSVPALIASLSDENEQVRLHVVRALGEIEDESSVSALVNAHTDPNADVRAHVAASLGELEHPESTSALMIMLTDENERVRYHAAHALGEIEDPASLPALGRILTNDPSPQVRQVAARALSEFDSPDAVPFLKAGLRDGDLNVQRSSARALGEFDDVSAVDELIHALGSEDLELRANSAYALGELRSEKAVPALVSLLDDNSNEVRISAIRALGSIRVEDEAVSRTLLRILESDDNREVRREAARALSEM